VYWKQYRSSRLSNAHVQRRAAWRAPCPARGVTRECVRWNGLLAGESPSLLDPRESNGAEINSQTAAAFLPQLELLTAKR